MELTATTATSRGILFKFWLRNRLCNRKNLELEKINYVCHLKVSPIGTVTGAARKLAKIFLSDNEFFSLQMKYFFEQKCLIGDMNGAISEFLPVAFCMITWR